MFGLICHEAGDILLKFVRAHDKARSYTAPYESVLHMPASSALTIGKSIEALSYSQVSI